MRPPQKSWAEVEQAAGIARTTPAAPTRNDLAALTRKRLGPLWGRPRKKGSLR